MSTLSQHLALLMACCASHGKQRAHAKPPAATEALRTELSALRPTQLRKRAVGAGIELEQIEAAEDSDTPKQSLIELLLQTEDENPASMSVSEATKRTAARRTLIAELATLKPTQLRKRAVAAGVPLERIDEAEDGETPQESVTELILAAHAVSTAETARTGKPLRAHSGSGQSVRKPPQRAGGVLSAIPNAKHAMLSYEWCVCCHALTTPQPMVVRALMLLVWIRDDQRTVERVHKELQARGVKCWMDIHGGMKGDIYDSMARGVQGAACVVCFMSKKYQVSENCKLVRPLTRRCSAV